MTFNLEVVAENEGGGVMRKLTLSPTHPSTLSIIRSRDCGVATQVLLKNIFDKYYLSLNKVNYYFFFSFNFAYAVSSIFFLLLFNMLYSSVLFVRCAGRASLLFGEGVMIRIFFRCDHKDFLYHLYHCSSSFTYR